VNLTGKLGDKDHLAAILAAVKLDASDYALLTDASIAKTALGLPKPELSDDALSLDNLSHLFRVASLARALKLSVAEVLSAKALFGIDPLATDDKAGDRVLETRRFVEKVRKLKGARVNLGELDYLLRDVSPPGSNLAPQEDAIAEVLGDIRSGLLKIIAENTPDPAGDPTGTVTRQKLNAVLGSSLAETALTLLSDGADATDADKAAIAKAFPLDAAKAESAFIDANFATFVDAGAATQKLVGQNALTKKVERFAYVLAAVLAYLVRTLGESLVKQKLADALALDPKVADRLLSLVLKARSDGSLRAVADFTAGAFVSGSTKLIADNYPNQFGQYLVLDKAARIISRFKLDADEISWLSQHHDYLDFNQLPVAPAATGPFASWERVLDLVTLRDRLPAGQPTLFALLDAAAVKGAKRTDVFPMIVARTGWPLDQLQDAKSPDGPNRLGLVFPDDYQDERAYLRLADCFGMANRIGASAAALAGWATADVTADIAAGIKKAAKSRSDRAGWLAVAKPLSDVLRARPHRRQRPLRPLSHRRRDGRLPGDFAREARDWLGATIRPALSHEPRGVQLSRGQADQEGACHFPSRGGQGMELDAELSPVGSESEGVPLPGELDRA
jgi:hypothetical protein